MELERRIYIGLLYIIDDKKYLEHYKKGVIKHIPEIFLPKIKPNIIDDIIQGDELIGKIAGINMKPIEFNDEKELMKYIEAIRNIKTEDFTDLYIEDHKSISNEIIRYIGNSLDMKVSNGISIKIAQIPLVIKKIYDVLKEDLGEKEILILCDNGEILKKVIKGISKQFKLITAIGYDKEYENEIYEYILEETGLSLFYSSNINKILENYSIIVNLMNDFDLDCSKIKKNCLIFDLGEPGLFENKGDKYKRIKDFVFDFQTLGIDETKWIANKVHSDLYESLNQDGKKRTDYLFYGNDYYTVEEYVNLFIRLSGKL